MLLTTFLEKDLLPDPLIRTGIRRLLKQRLRDEKKPETGMQQKHLSELVKELKTSPLAVQTQEANDQHYEVPVEFFELCLGKNLKYSCAYWNTGDTLNQAEERMLELTCQRARLKDGQQVLELGCGWGSLTLFMAERYPNSNITAVSNSHSQKKFIDEKAKKRGLDNLTIITADINDFSVQGNFDRIVSIEMFEHMRNYKELLSRISSWLKPDGLLFVHIFVHRELAYKFEVKDKNDWMSKYFFSGGIMPSDHLLFYFNEHLRIRSHWRVSGEHYGKTAEAWLKNMDKNKSTILNLFKNTYGEKEAKKWLVYWRVFFMSCAELWNFRKGEEWFVSHYLFEKQSLQ